ncbi:SLBB domain-containing protein [Marinomonas rhodophyticola]|uniref:SLBB domain-containing protein n=1 Tax=Marinomonas rhodophyticola TaxID=2992803 RepID=A0ABT3KK74_9GAMM|nr:SLBB domain-containing protein [Marinomonas sp. KJ51-3]MCW4630970.1 SLBB domain-containing protein [Marinomonas sp. KJ51-3]
MRLKKRLLPILMMTLAGNLLAFTPTAEQISQFQSLPQAQQEALARQYGVDLGSLTGGATNIGSAPVQQAPVLEPVVSEATSAPVAQAAADDSDGVPLFGYDVLGNNSLGLTVVDNLPVPLDYQMVLGDVISVQIFGKSNQNLSLAIDRDGSINLPDIGPVAVAGQTFAQLRQQLNDVIKNKTIGVDVSVTMGAMRTMQVYIVGEAIQPGAYNVNGLTTITQALIASGGVKKSGSLRHIKLMRKGQVISDFDLYDLLLKGDTSKDLRLSSGDTLFIPLRDNSITIEGQVARPAVYETKGDTTLGQLLSLAGGAKPQAYLSRVSVRRASSNGLQLFTLDLATTAGQRFKLKNGDDVNLSAAASSLRNAVAVRGEVVRQGALNFTPGMKVSDAIGSMDDGLKQTADLNYALLVREVNANQAIEIYQFSLLDALTKPNSEANLLLQEKDQIFVFDNGLEQDYWFGSYANSKAKPSGIDKARETVDAETGAVVEQNESSTLNIAGTEVASNAAELRKASREALLRPIMDRLKEQASYGNPAKLIEVSGAVKFPGLYPLAKNANVASLLAAAGGLTQEAYLASAELTRRKTEGDRSAIDRINFSLKDAISGKYPIALNAQDHLIIKSQPGWQEGMVVELQGEFVFPGTYTFRRGETLKDVVERAGGFTEFAYPSGAVFSRDSLKRQEAERLKFINAQLKQEISAMSLRRQGSTSVADPAQAIAVVDQLDNVVPVGRLVIDLNKAMKGNNLANLMLEKGDKLFVPALNPVVSIVGEVQFASNHTYNLVLTVEDYIASAGGTKRQADTDRIYIVKANGSVELPNNSFWFSRNSAPLEH